MTSTGIPVRAPFSSAPIVSVFVDTTGRDTVMEDARHRVFRASAGQADEWERRIADGEADANDPEAGGYDPEADLDLDLHLED